jgi:recombination protein RecT
MTSTSLAQRARGEVAEQGTTPTLQDQIRAMEQQFAMAMPKGMEAAQLVRDALTSLRQTPDLAKCTPSTVLGALMSCAQLGLRPGVLGHAWVLPFWDSKSRGHKAQLVVGYKGYVDLAYRNPQVSSVIARTVYEGDTFDVDYGLEDRLIHKPALTGDRSKPIAHYAIFKTASGGRAFWVMTDDEVQAWRDRYAPRNRQQKIVGPWVSDYEAMARKTCLLRLAAWMPKSTELAYAIEVDNGVRVSVDPKADLAESTHHYEQDAGEESDVVDGEVEVDAAPSEDEPS